MADSTDMKNQNKSFPLETFSPVFATDRKMYNTPKLVTESKTLFSKTAHRN